VSDQTIDNHLEAMTTVSTITFISKPVMKNKEAALIKINRPDDPTSV